MSRTIQSNLCDGVKQEAIKLLLVGDVCTEAAAARGRTLLDNTALLSTAAPAPGGMEAARAGPPAPRAAPAGGRWTVPSCRALRSAGTPARPGDMSGLQLRVVFFYEMGSHVWPQEEAERLRKKTKFFMLMGPRVGRVRGAHRATWKVPMVARGQKAGAGEHVGRGLYRAFRGKGRAGRAAWGRPV